MARKPFANREIQKELCGQLGRYFDEHPEQNKSKLARRLGVSRAALYKYLKGDTTPSAEVLAKLLGLPGIVLTLGGRIIGPSDVEPAVERPKFAPLQYALPFDQPVYIEQSAQKVTLGIVRRGICSKDALEFTVEIKLPMAG